MTALATFEGALRAHGCKGGRGSWTCPAHEDRSPSLAVKAGNDGRVLVRCFAGCETPAVVAAVGLGLRDLFDATTPTPPRRRRLATPAGPLPALLRGRHGLPNADDLFWRQPAAVIDAHFAALPPGPSDEELRAFLAERQAGELARVE